MNTTTLGIDLAKNIFQLHEVDKNSCVTFRKALSHSKLLVFTARFPPCLIGIEDEGNRDKLTDMARDFFNIGITQKEFGFDSATAAGDSSPTKRQPKNFKMLFGEKVLF